MSTHKNQQPMTAALALLAGMGMMQTADAGLGKLKVLSQPGEPFAAEADLVGEGILTNPSIGLANPDQYGAVKPFSAQAGQLSFSLHEVAPGQYKVKVYGPAVQNTDRLRFAVQVQWGEGRVIREYDISPRQVAAPKVQSAEVQSVLKQQGPVAMTGTAALSLGPVVALSSLEQPLRAEIVLGGSLSKTPSDQIQINFPKLAAHSAEAQRVLSQASFKVVTRGARKILILESPAHVHSTNLLVNVEVKVGERAISRDYLLPFKSVQMQEKMTKAPKTAKSMASVKEAARYQVKEGDTLSEIAQQFYPGVSQTKAMRALVRQNTHAFINGNPNKLKANVHLALPILTHKSLSENAVLNYRKSNQSSSTKALKAKSQTQVVADKKSKLTLSLTTPNEPLPTKSTPKGEATAIQAPNNVANAKSASASQNSADSTANAQASAIAFEREVKRLEQIAQAKRARVEEAKTRLAQLEAKVQELMQAQGIAPVAAAEPVANTAPATTTANIQPDANAFNDADITDSDVMSTSAALADTKVAASNGVQELAPSKTSASLTHEQTPANMDKPLTQAESSWLDGEIKNYAMYGGAALLIGLLALLLIRRRRAGVEEIPSHMIITQDPLMTPTTGAQGVSTLFGSAETLSAYQVHDNSDQVDLYQEAELMIAYNKLSEAETLLNRLLEQEPNREDARLKLLQVLMLRENKEGFEAQARIVLRSVESSNPMWHKVVMMGKELDPSNKLYRLDSSVEEIAQEYA